MLLKQFRCLPELLVLIVCILTLDLSLCLLPSKANNYCFLLFFPCYSQPQMCRSLWPVQHFAASPTSQFRGSPSWRTHFLPTCQVSFTHLSDEFLPTCQVSFYPRVRWVLPTCQVSFTQVSGEFYPIVRWGLPTCQVSYYPRVRWVLPMDQISFTHVSGEFYP